MQPEEIRRRVRDSRVGSRAHAAADRAYQRLIRPDRPIEPEVGKKPWLAALLSLAVVGAGQLYNRQLAKSLLLFLGFYVAGGLLWAILWALEWKWQIGTRTPEVAYSFRVVWGCLWLFAVVDAYRIAEALRTGQLVVRYGFARQAAHFAVSCVPFVGMAAPGETVRPDELAKPVADAAKEIARDRLLEWVVVRALRILCLGAGAAMIAAGLLSGIRPLVTFGGLAIAVGILLFLA